MLMPILWVLIYRVPAIMAEVMLQSFEGFESSVDY